MLPTLVTEIPIGNEWCYQVKYDGFRAMIYIDDKETKIISRNLNELDDQFPEIVQCFQRLTENQDVSPIIFDGELCVLETENKAAFDKIQKRGRLKDKEKINHAKNTLPVTFLAFDLLMFKGKPLTNQPLHERQRQLNLFFSSLNSDITNFREVKTYDDASFIWNLVKKEGGEGIVAKQTKSFWEPGKRSKHWLKIKNLLIASFVVLAYDEKNAFFHIGCVHNDEFKMIGKVGQGFSKEEKEALITIIKKNCTKREQSILYVKPSICIEVEFLEVSKNELRHPKFRRFRFDKQWEDCTWEKVQKQEQN